jgi:long-chain acyl-CoA synthetase
MKRFYPTLYLDYIRKYKVTFSALVSTQIDNLIKEKKYFNNFSLKKGLVSCSSKLFESTKKTVINRKISLHEMYGASEIGTVSSINHNKNNLYTKSVGKTYDRNIVIKIVSENNKFLGKNKIGEIVCKTPGIFKGYLNSKNFPEEAFFKDYFKTGDIGYLNAKGYLFFLGRKKNVVKKSGINIFPNDIESTLLENKKFKEVAVVPIIKKKETKMILFVKKDKNLNYDFVRNFCLKNLSNYQLPDKIIMIKKFPKTITEKIDRQKLKVEFLIN